MKVHTGCKNCYAETLDNRYHNETPHWGPGTSRKAVKSSWNSLNKFQRDSAKEGVIKRVFVGSMMDIFEDPLPAVDDNNNTIELDDPDSVLYTSDLRETFFNNISRGQYPNLLFLLLTKRPENINKYIPSAWLKNPPANVMFGTSVVDQETADKMVPELLNVNGKRFLSCEPLLGSCDISKYLPSGSTFEFYYQREKGLPWGISWVICGGESGPKARPMHPDWARSLRNQCSQADVPYFFKQWGEWHESDLEERPEIGMNGRFLWPDGKLMYKVGKQEAGNILDGVEHKNFPKI